MFRKARAGRECKKLFLTPEIFRILSFPTIFSSPFRSQFLSFPFRRSRLTLAATLSPSCVFNPPHPPLTATRWLSSLFDFWHACISPSSLSSLLLSIPALFPLRLQCRPKLESNFPHHIPQKLLRGGAGSSATHSSWNEGTAKHFYLLFASILLSLSLLPTPPPPAAPELLPPEVKQFRNILPLAFPAPLSEHARLLCRPAYSTLVEDVITRIPHYRCRFPVASFPCFRPTSSLHRCCTLFDTQEISWEKESLRSKLAN